MPKGQKKIQERERISKFELTEEFRIFETELKEFVTTGSDYCFEILAAAYCNFKNFLFFSNAIFRFDEQKSLWTQMKKIEEARIYICNEMFEFFTRLEKKVIYEKKENYIIFFDLISDVK